MERGRLKIGLARKLCKTPPGDPLSEGSLIADEFCRGSLGGATTGTLTDAPRKTQATAQATAQASEELLLKSV